MNVTAWGEGHFNHSRGVMGRMNDVPREQADELCIHHELLRFFSLDDLSELWKSENACVQFSKSLNSFPSFSEVIFI